MRGDYERYLPAQCKLNDFVAAVTLLLLQRMLEHEIRFDIYIHLPEFISISALCKDDNKPDWTNDASEGSTSG